jgi:hypothetical protein
MNNELEFEDMSVYPEFGTKYVPIDLNDFKIEYRGILKNLDTQIRDGKLHIVINIEGMYVHFSMAVPRIPVKLMPALAADLFDHLIYGIKVPESVVQHACNLRGQGDGEPSEFLGEALGGYVPHGDWNGNYLVIGYYT